MAGNLYTASEGAYHNVTIFANNTTTIDMGYHQKRVPQLLGTLKLVSMYNGTPCKVEPSYRLIGSNGTVVDVGSLRWYDEVLI